MDIVLEHVLAGRLCRHHNVIPSTVPHLSIPKPYRDGRTAVWSWDNEAVDSDWFTTAELTLLDLLWASAAPSARRCTLAARKPAVGVQGPDT
jgi:hypothetical protein